MSESNIYELSNNPSYIADNQHMPHLTPASWTYVPNPQDKLSRLDSRTTRE